ALAHARQEDDGLAQRLGRDRARVRADAAERLAAVDHGDAAAELGGLDRGALAARTGADGEEVVVELHRPVIGAPGQGLTGNGVWRSGDGLVIIRDVESTPQRHPHAGRVRALRPRAAITLEPTHPFAFDATFHKPDHFPSQDTAWEPGVRWQTMRFRGRVLGLRIEEAPAEVRVGVWAERPVPRTLLAPLSGEVAWRANLRLDLGDFERRARRDGQLAPA